MDTYLLRDQLAARAATPADFDALKRLDKALAKHDALCVEQANLRLQTLQLRVAQAHDAARDPTQIHRQHPDRSGNQR
jgi:hypothetical protein